MKPQPAPTTRAGTGCGEFKADTGIPSATARYGKPKTPNNCRSQFAASPDPHLATTMGTVRDVRPDITGRRETTTGRAMGTPEERYMTYPLAVLRGPIGGKAAPTPATCIGLAIDCAVVIAGRGYRKHHGDNEFEQLLNHVMEDLEWHYDVPCPEDPEAKVLVGAHLCGVRLTQPSLANCKQILARFDAFHGRGPLVRMKASLVWDAKGWADAEKDPDVNRSRGGISWTDFRVLSAILSKVGDKDYASVGWIEIQARGNGYSGKLTKAAQYMPLPHLPELSRKVIRNTTAKLEKRKFFARFRLSRGTRGGKLFYSFRHPDRTTLGKEVIEHYAKWRRSDPVQANRAADAALCAELLPKHVACPVKGPI